MRTAAGNGTSEWPLTVFTVCTQAAAGCSVLRAVLRADAATDPILPLALALLVAGALAAGLHLRRPGTARFALANLGSSWLSREVLLGLAFGTALVIQTALPRLEVLGIVTAVLGLVLVLSIARIYMLRTVPAWNTWATPAAFFATALLLGAASGAVVTITASPRAPVWLGVFAAAAATVQLCVLHLHLRALARAPGAAAESARVIREVHRRVLALRILATLLGAAILLAATWPGSPLRHPAPVFAAVVLLLAAELLGRLLFYASHRRVGL